MPSLVFYRGYEGILVTQSLPSSQHTAFLLPTLSKALELLDLMVLSQQSTLGPPQDPEHPHLPLPEQGRGPALCRISPLLTQMFSPRD